LRPNLWCHYHRLSGRHSTSECKAKLEDPEYLQFQEQQQKSQQLPPDYQPPLVYTTTSPEERVNMIRACKTASSSPKSWIYDTACTETITSEPQFFFSYTEFPAPIPVSSIGNSTLYARGSGTIYLQSLPDINNSSIHRFDDVWLAPYQWS
jgi:hypothetical protein